MKRWYIAGGVLLSVICILCTALHLMSAMPEENAGSEAESRIAAELEARSHKGEEQEKPDPAGLKHREADQDEIYISPVDFESLQAQNPDIYAWLYIPDTDISYPLLQSRDDDTFYLNHDSEGKENKNGALFSENRYNNREFTDPVTIIYGHHMRSGAMFGRLQELYSQENGLAKYQDMYVYLPDREQKYEAVAALPFESDHILYYYDFSYEAAYQAFLDRIGRVRSMGAHIDRKKKITSRDQLLILSTCLNGNNKKRYLVLARRTDNK